MTPLTDHDGRNTPTEAPTRPPFTASSTAADVLSGLDLAGRCHLAAGGAGGLVRAITEDGQRAETLDDGTGRTGGVGCYALDPAAADRVWDLVTAATAGAR